jgi:hypothetical protein
VEKRTKLTIGAAAAAAFVLAVALGAVGGYAAAEAFSDESEPEVVAARVDVEPDDEQDDEPRDESESLTEALEFLVDEAVEAGRLTEEEGEELKERLGATRLPFVVPDLERLPFREFFDGGGLGVLFGEIVDLGAAASYLGLTESELREELEDGSSLAQVARAEGESVDGLVDALVADAESRIDDAVEDGRLSEERAAELKDELEDRVRVRVHDPGGLARPFGYGFGFEFPKRLPDFRGPNG